MNSIVTDSDVRDFRRFRYQKLAPLIGFAPVLLYTQRSRFSAEQNLRNTHSVQRNTSSTAITLPFVVLMNPKSFPAQMEAASSSTDTLDTCDPHSSSYEAIPSASTHFLANFRGNSLISEAGREFWFNILTTNPSCERAERQKQQLEPKRINHSLTSLAGDIVPKLSPSEKTTDAVESLPCNETEPDVNKFCLSTTRNSQPRRPHSFRYSSP